LFKQAFELVKSKQHLTKEGLRKIVSIRASINKGLTDALTTAFPDTTPIQRPKVEVPEKIDPNWLAGFTDGEACFYVLIYKAKTKTGFAVQIRFILTQHSRDILLFKYVQELLGCGDFCVRFSNSAAADFKVTSFSDI
jgi:hypothetical protein